MKQKLHLDFYPFEFSRFTVFDFSWVLTLERSSFRGQFSIHFAEDKWIYENQIIKSNIQEKDAT